jgi:hypothetical protein
MNAPVPQASDTESSITLDKVDEVIIISKKSWYKEASGFVAVMAWLAIIAISAWAILADIIPAQPLYLGVLCAIALGASALRNNSVKVDLGKVEL